MIAGHRGMRQASDRGAIDRPVASGQDRSNANAAARIGGYRGRHPAAARTRLTAQNRT